MEVKPVKRLGNLGEIYFFLHSTSHIISTFSLFFPPVFKIIQDQKKFHEQLATEQETFFGSRPSPVRPLGPKKVVGPRSAANGGASNGTPSRRLSLNTHQNGMRSASRDGKRDLNRAAPPVINYVAISKEDAASHVSGHDPIPASPWFIQSL